MKFSPRRRPDPMLDITPMIDIVFQLVLFFMVSTTFISAPGIQVDLPKANSEMVVRDNKDLNIWVTMDGAVYVEDDPVDQGELRRRLRASAEADPNTLVVIKADAGVGHGRVVAVMDLARTIGLTRLAIATETAQGGGSGRPDGEDPPPP